MTQISLALPTYNRFDFLLECIAQVIDDPRIGEIVISDDVSTNGSFERLCKYFSGHHKVKLFQNEKNVDCYFNKQKAVQRATHQWVILFDDDNVINTEYLDTLYRIAWQPDTVYAPDFAQPHFNYTAFSGLTIDRKTVSGYVPRRHFCTLLNTCNYFVNREAFLQVWDGSIDPHTADSLFQMVNWFEAGKKLAVVRDLRYFHRVHSGSHHKNNHHKTGNLVRRLEERLRGMR